MDIIPIVQEKEINRDIIPFDPIVGVPIFDT